MIIPMSCLFIIYYYLPLCENPARHLNMCRYQTVTRYIALHMICSGMLPSVKIWLGAWIFAIRGQARIGHKWCSGWSSLLRPKSACTRVRQALASMHKHEEDPGCMKLLSRQGACGLCHFDVACSPSLNAQA